MPVDRSVISIRSSNRFEETISTLRIQTDRVQARILIVGAGGIGCELLKNVVLTGFGEIHIIDLDTIDLSNLNRQFLFHKEHIKKSKALVGRTHAPNPFAPLANSLRQVAKESASRFNPHVKIYAHHANIKDPACSISWFRSFSIVFNALDNLDARRHVNRLCLAAEVPLVESGTTGFNGQVQVIKKGVSECYDCNPKETPKTFPVCTIRSTPSQPIHCIVWAKSYLFAEVFGVSEDEAPEMDTTEDSENAGEIETLKQEAHALKRIRESMGSKDFPRKVFTKVFDEDIKRLRSMEDMWKSRGKLPDPLDFDELSKEALGVGEEIARKDQSIWTAAENFAVFSTSLRRLSDRLEELRANADVGNAAPVLSFDKDDKDTLDFVAASANLRSSIFGIEPKSEFEIKRKFSMPIPMARFRTSGTNSPSTEMAGNIIPAIATTNAITAGLAVLQSFKVLRNHYHRARMIFLTRSTDRILSSEPLRSPKPDCPICGPAQSFIGVDPTRATLKHLVDALREVVRYTEDISISSERGILFDPDLEDNLPKKMADLGVGNDTWLTVADEADESPRMNLVLFVHEKESSPETPPVVLPEVHVPVKPQATNGHDEHAVNGVDAAGSKRKREAGDEADVQAEIVAKRGKVMEEADIGGNEAPKDDEKMTIDVDDADATGGAIVIDDD